MIPRRFRCVLLAGAASALAFFSGCAGGPKVVPFPYAMPMAAAAAPQQPAAAIQTVVDRRADRSLDPFLAEPPVELVKQAVAAEFASAALFSHVATEPAPARIGIAVELLDLSWAVPNHDRMMKTAFWTSFLTGGIGGLAYGSTETPVLGHASIHFKVSDQTTGRALFDDTVEAVHQEKMAKLKCDTLETRANIMAAALKDALTKAATAIGKAQHAGPAAPPAT